MAKRKLEQQNADAVAVILADASHADRERLARIVNLLPCYVVLIDSAHHIRFYNTAFEQFFGSGEGRLCYTVFRGASEPCRACPPLDGRNAPTGTMGTTGDARAASDTPSSNVMEWVHPHTKHAFRVYSYPFEEPGGPQLVLKVGFNITSSMRVQQALDLSEQSYRVITDNLSIGIALLDLKLRVKAGNNRLTQWFGPDFTRERRVCEVLRCPGCQMPDRADTGRAFDRADCLFMAAARDRASHEKEFAVTLQDGTERSMRMVACPVAPRKGDVRALIMMLEDITNRLHVNQQLQRARKIEAMGTLAGGIAHEINQPLSALHLYASGLQMLMEKGEPSRDTTQERLSLIMHEAEKIRSIITHMRALVMREGEVTLEPVSVRQALSNAVSILENQFSSRDIRVQMVVPADLPLVRSNPLQFEQVLVNLLGNAVHALSSSENPPAQRVISVIAGQKQDGGRVRIEVADSGPGLPKGCERIFDPFYTTKESHQGMGLGLSIVHGLVRLWGGEVSALPRHPRLGGAAFYVELAVADWGSASGLVPGTASPPGGMIPPGPSEKDRRESGTYRKAT